MIDPNAGLNQTLLFNSDNHVKIRLVSQILAYTEECLSTTGSAYTRGDFLELCRMILDPDYRHDKLEMLQDEIAEGSKKTMSLIFGHGTGVIKHLRLISKLRSRSDDAKFSLLKLVYLADGKQPT